MWGSSVALQRLPAPRGTEFQGAAPCQATEAATSGHLQGSTPPSVRSKVDSHDASRQL